MEKYIKDIEDIDALVNEEYSQNKRSLMDGKEAVSEAVKEDKEEGFTKSYFSIKLEFAKKSNEHREKGISYACIRMLAFKKFLQEELGYTNIETDVIEFDNRTTYVRAVINHE